MSDARYRVVAYVCDGGVVREVNDLGFSLPRDFYARNRDGCRYAVTETSDGVFRVFDMWEFHFDEMFRAVEGPYRDFDTEDAAIMACVLTDHYNSTIMQYIARYIRPLKG